MANLITNPGFEANLTEWSGLNGAALARVTNRFHTGNASCRVTPSGSILLSGPLTNVPGLAPNTTYDFSIAIWGVAGQNYVIQWDENDASGGYLRTITVGGIPAANGSAWDVVNTQVTTGADTASANLYIYDNRISNQQFWIDTVFVEEQGEIGPSEGSATISATSGLTGTGIHVPPPGQGAAVIAGTSALFATPATQAALYRVLDTDFGMSGVQPQSWFNSAKAAGYDGFITTLHTYWDANPQPWPPAVTALERALAAGMWIAAYGRPVSHWNQALDVLPANLRQQLKFFALDVEPEPAGNIQVTRAMVDGVISRGVRPVIYTGRWMWEDVMGNITDTSFSDVPLWEFAGDRSGWPATITESPIFVFAGWNTGGNWRIGQQIRMQNPVLFNGIWIDDDVFTTAFIDAGQTPPPQSGSATIAGISTLSATPYYSASRTATLAGSSELTAAGMPGPQLGSAALQGGSFLSATGAAASTGFGAAIIAGTSLLQANGFNSAAFVVAFPPAKVKTIIAQVWHPNGFNYIRTWRDLATEPRYTWGLNSGPSAMQISLPRKWADSGEDGEGHIFPDMHLGNLVKLFVFDRETGPEGHLIYQGTIGEYSFDMVGQKLDLTLIPRTSVQNDVFVRDRLIYSNLDPADIFADVVNRFATGVTYSPATSAKVGLLFDARFENQTLRQIFDTLRLLAGGSWYYRFNIDNTISFNTFGEVPVANHVLRVGKELGSNISFIKSAMERKTRVFVYGAWLAEERSVVVTAHNFQPNNPLDLVYHNSRIEDSTTAARIGWALLNFYNSTFLETEVTVNDSTYDPVNGYDIESLKPGDVVSILHPDHVEQIRRFGDPNPVGDGYRWGGSWLAQTQRPIVIAEVNYEYHHARLKLQQRPLRFASELWNLADRLQLEST